MSFSELQRRLLTFLTVEVVTVGRRILRLVSGEEGGETRALRRVELELRMLLRLSGLSGSGGRGEEVGRGGEIGRGEEIGGGVECEEGEVEIFSLEVELPSS